MKGLSRWSSGVLIAAAMAFVAPSTHAGDVTLEVSGECPGRVVLQWSEAEPDRPMGIFYGPREGETTLPGDHCGGTRLGIAGGVYLVAIRRSGLDGSGSVEGGAIRRICGGYLQLVVWNSQGPCETSNVAHLPQ